MLEPMRRLRPALLGLLASLVWAAPAGAFTSPVLYVRLPGGRRRPDGQAPAGAACPLQRRTLGVQDDRNLRGRFDAKGRAIVKVRRPPAGLYAGILSVSGTRFYTKSVDPNLVLLGVSGNGKLAYVSPSVFPQCQCFR
jgi:hypothetical protein